MSLLTWWHRTLYNATADATDSVYIHDVLSLQLFRFRVDGETCARLLPCCARLSSGRQQDGGSAARDKFCTCRKQAPRYAHDIHLESWISKSLKAYRTTGIIVYFLCDGGIQLCFNTSINIYVYFLGRGLFYSLTVKFDRELERGAQSFLCRWLCV